MRLCSLTASASILALASLVFADADSDVISLTTKNFEESVATEPLVLVEFFAPWYVSTCHFGWQHGILTPLQVWSLQGLGSSL
jgi:hypothetical protein